MPDTNDKIKALYNAASQKFDIGTEQDFRQKLTDPAKRKAFYDAASVEFDLGTYDEYEKKLGPTQKQIDEGKAMAAKVPSFKDFAAQRGVYVPKVGEIQVTSDIAERLPSLSRKAEIAKDVQEAPERIKLREERKEKAKADALKNNTIKALTASGTKFTEGDAVYKKMQENIKSVVEKGAMTLSADAAGNPVYKRSAGIIESFINNFEASRKDIKDSEVFRKSSDTESVKIAEEIIKGIEQEAVPSGAAAEISGMFGSAAPLLGRAVIGGGAAAKFLPGPAKAVTALGSFLTTISPSYDQAYKQGAVELYAKGIEEMKRQKRLKGQRDELSQQEKEEAMRMAKNEAGVSGFAEGIFVAGLSSIPLGSSVAGQSFKKAMVNFAKNTAKEVPRNVTLGAASEAIKDISAANAGYNITEAETLNSILERSGQDAITTLAFEVGFNIKDVANVPKYVKAAATNYLSTIPTLEFNNFAKDLEARGIVEPGFAEKATADVNKFKESKARVASFIPEGDMPSFAGLIEKKTNLENQKKSTDPAFHAKIDEQITAVDERIKKMQESPNPIFDEVDELTGDTGDATPITETEIEKSIEYTDGFTPAQKEIINATDVSKKLQYYQQANPVKLEDIDGGFMITGGLTDLQSAAQKADKKTTITEPTKIEFLPENISLVHLARNAYDASSIIDKGFNVEEVNIDSPVPGVYFSSEDWSTMDRFGREKSNALLTEIKNDGLVYFDNTDEFRKFLNNNNLPSQGQTLSKGQIDLLKSKGIKGILLREDFASNSRNELIVIDPSIIQSVKKYSGEETTNLPSSFSDADLIADVYKKYKQEGSNPEFVKLVEQKLLEAPTEVESVKEVEMLRAEEQKELESAIPNIEEYKVDGVVDRTKITNEEDLANFDEIYNKYDKLITPLLEPAKVSEANIFKIDGAEKFFHASPNKITGPLKKSTAKGFGTGIYFSTNKDIVKSEFGENVTEVSLNIENPVYTNTKEWIDVQSLAIKLADADYGKKKGLTLEEGETFHRYDSENLSEIDEIPSEFISKAAQELGHDAIVDKGSAAYDNEVLVLDESKIQYKEVVEEKPTEINAMEGSGGMIKFAEGVEIPYKYKIIESEGVKPSHLPSGERNPEHTIALAQPKERGDIQSKLAQEKIAASPNLREVGESPNPYFGAPVVNARGEVIQGNNRSLGLKRHYNEGGTSYKKQLADNAEKFGMTKEQVDKMKNPILVRESPIDDAMAVELGNYDVKDLETGGKQRIDPITTVRKMTPEDKNKLASLIFDGEYSTVKEAIRDNQQQVGSIISKQINAAQRNTIFDKEGNINPKGMEDIENIVNNMLFESGPAVLPEAFNELSYSQQKNIQKSIKHIFNTPEGKSILPEVQNAVLGLYDYRKSGIDNFNAWLSTIDIFQGTTPRDIFTPVEINLMETLVKAKNQSELAKQLSSFADLVKGKPADMFEPERAGISKKEAINKLFNVEYEDVAKRYAEPEGKATDEGAILAKEPELKIERATPEEAADFDGFAKRELERKDFDAEYKSARVEGETKEQYLIRKYCK